MLRRTRSRLFFVPSTSFLVWKRASALSAISKHAQPCVARSCAGRIRTAVPALSMVIEGYDSTSNDHADIKTNDRNNNSYSTDEETFASSPSTSDEERAPFRDSSTISTMPQRNTVNTRLFLAGGATVVIAGLVVIAWSSGALSGESFLALAAWFESLGPVAVVLYALFYFVLELVAVPALPLTLGSGYLFGVTTGTALVSVASTAAATTAFLISRYGLRDYITSVATKYPRFRAMDRAIGREGFKFVFLLRLSPLLPFSISNYLYGLTSVKLSQYVLGSWLGMLPGTIAYVSAGAAVNALTDLNLKDNPVNPALLVIGVVATIIVLVFIARLATNVVHAEGDLEEEAA